MLLAVCNGRAYVMAEIWSSELVDVAGAGKFSSMRIDKSGNIHVAYMIEDGIRNPLKYALWDRLLKRWFTMTVAEGASVCSLALDSKDRPHISWVDFGTASGSKLRYAAWNGSAWNVQAIPLNSDVIAYDNSLVLDGQDRPAIAFYEYRGPKDTDLHIRMRVVMLRDGVWQVRTIDPEEGSGKFNAMAVDDKDRIHLAYANVSAGTEGLRYAMWDGQHWTSEIVEDLGRNNGETVGYSVAIAADSDGNPHVTYMNWTTGQMRYAVRKGGRWTIQVVDAVSKVAYPDRNGITLDNTGRVYISYYDGGRGELKLAYMSGGAQWTLETVAVGYRGFTSSVQIYGNEIWISYADEASNGLAVAHRVLSPRLGK
jgi:hypothetical protein